MEKLLGQAAVARILGAGPAATQRQEKLRCIWEGLLDLYQPRDAEKWLRTSAEALGQRCPLDIMAEERGLDQVLDVLGRMTWGLPD